MNNEQITLKVRTILLRDWDPCGVGSNDALADEYDEYLPAIVALVARRASPSAVNQTLSEFERELGVALPDQQRERAVQALLTVN